MRLDPRQLPIWALRDPIVDAIHAHGRFVLVAATGSGKTTQVPQMLLDAGVCGGGAEGKRIVVLQPRRVAARTVASRVAWERGGKLGGEVGYQVRFEDHIARDTRLCFVTEGILLRWLQDDRTLHDVGIVVFDEFHERNLLSDVALALVKELRRTSRPDLGIVVMSATLEAEPVARYLGPGVPILASEGRTYPVEIRWADYTDARPEVEKAVSAVEEIISNGWDGDILVFMPGKSEIQATIRELGVARLGEKVTLMALHGDLPPEDQDRAFQPSDRRKIVVSTNVAETSVTIDGVRHVVDSGLARVARYDAERGIQTLLLEEISQASADQRAGRAGRTAPGTCWRLWTEGRHASRPASNTPEIQRADLAEIVLLLHSLGVRRAVEFDWLDKPEREAVERAERMLVTLGALVAGDAGHGELTEVGRRMLRLPMHPRFGRMLVEAGLRGCVTEAALCAALVSGRDLLVRIGRDEGHLQDRREAFEDGGTSDFHTLLRAHEFARNHGFSVDACRRNAIHAQTAQQVEDTHRQILQLAGREGLGSPNAASPGEPQSHALERCLVAGFVDQLCVRKDSGTLDCHLTEGRTGTLVRESVVQKARMLVAASVREVSGRGGTLTLLSQCTAVEMDWLREMFPQHFSAGVEHLYDRTHKRVAAINIIRFLDLVVDQQHQREVDPVAAGRCLADAFSKGWLDLPNLDHGVQQWIGRVECLRAAVPELELIPMRTHGLLQALETAFRGLTLGREAQSAALLPAFRAVLSKDQQSFVEELAPLQIRAPDGRNWKLTYASERDEPEAPPVPEVQAKLTDCLALQEHPRIAEGRVPIRIWLQDPAGRRLASTRDWPAWRKTEYPKLRANLKSKHPGFLWP